MSSDTGSRELFEEVVSKDFLSFSFGGKGYQEQLNEATTKSNKFCAITVQEKVLLTASGQSVKVIYIAHNFAFLGGSLGSAGNNTKRESLFF